MKGVNKVTIIGQLGQDPETRYTAANVAITNISVATSDFWKDKETGENKEATEWHRVVFFGKLAEVAGEYLRKGSKVYVEGQLRTRKWQDQSGADRWSTEINARDMQMLDSRKDGDNTANTNNQRPQAQQQNNQPQQQQNNNQQSTDGRGYNQRPPQPEGVPFDDDIPF